jgi:hypothetical protein
MQALRKIGVTFGDDQVGIIDLRAAVRLNRCDVSGLGLDSPLSGFLDQGRDLPGMLFMKFVVQLVNLRSGPV